MTPFFSSVNIKINIVEKLKFLKGSEISLKRSRKEKKDKKALEYLEKFLKRKI